MGDQRHKGLKSLIHIAQNAVKESLAYMGSIQTKIDQENERKTTLLQYESDYQATFLKRGQLGVQGTAIEQHEAFMFQIQQALDNQSNQLFQLQEQLNQARATYNKLNQKLKSYQKLEERITEKALKTENKKMQNLLDEIAMQMHSRR